MKRNKLDTGRHIEYKKDTSSKKSNVSSDMSSQPKLKCKCECHREKYQFCSSCYYKFHEHQPKSECKHMPTLRCNLCDATWSDPRRAIEFLLKWMEDKPALKHNVDDFIHKSKVREIVMRKKKTLEADTRNNNINSDFIAGQFKALDDILEEIE